MKLPIKTSLLAKYFHGEFHVVEQDFIGYKKVVVGTQREIIELLVPRGALIYISSFCGGMLDKCRVSEAVVVKQKAVQAEGLYRRGYEYYLGKWCAPEKQFSARFKQCESGIHLFLTKQQARDFI